MIQEDYCSYEVSKLLKEKGFDEPIWTRYEDDNKVIFGDKYNWNNSPMGHTSAPTHQMAIAWLREIHDILIVVSITYEKERYDWYICGIKGDPWKKELFHEERDVTYDTYEEAVESALKYCLENLI